MSDSKDEQPTNGSSKSNAPQPLPRTRFFDPSDESADKQNLPNKYPNESSKTTKSAYSMFKGIFPSTMSNKRGADDQKQNEPSQTARRSITIPPRPRNRRYHNRPAKSHSQDIEPREKLDNKKVQSNKKPPVPDRSYKYKFIDESIHTSIPSTGSEQISSVIPKRSSNSQVPVNVVIHKRRQIRGSSSPRQQPLRNERLRPLTKKTISNLCEFVDKSQKATESIEAAKKLVFKRKYNEASQKYQLCLNIVDDVLETPLRDLQFSTNEYERAESIVFEMKLLRKNALQGFSDAQSSDTHPQEVTNIPAEAPPSYNDVLREDLLMNIHEGSNPVQPIECNYTRNSESQILSDNVQRSPLIQLQPNQLLLPAAASSLDKASPCNVSNKKNNESNIINAKEISNQPIEISVRPKVKTRIKALGIQVFPPDVEQRLLQQPKTLHGTNESRLEANVVMNTNRCHSTESLEETFVSAASSPFVSPDKKCSLPQINSNESNCQKDLTTDKENYQISDPFVTNNPFPSNQVRDNSLDSCVTFCNDTVSISPHSEKVEDISFLSGSYHTEIIQDSRSVLKQTNLDKTDFKMNSNLLANKKKTPATPDEGNHFKRKSDLAKSVANLSDHVHNTPKRNVKRTSNLLKMKKISRSNDSVLMMFDPIRNEDANHEDEVDESTAQYNPLYGRLVDISRTEQDTTVTSEEINIEKNGFTEPSQLESERPVVISENTLSEINGDKAIGDTIFENSKLPQLSSDDEVFIDKPVPPIPQHRSEYLEKKTSAALTKQIESLEKNILDIASLDTVDSADTNSISSRGSISSALSKKSINSGYKSVNINLPNEDTKPYTNTKCGTLDEDIKQLGKSSFYASEPTTPAEDAPVVPVRSSSIRKIPKLLWLEIISAQDAVKLFFLNDAGVSSPFNRQSLLVLRSSRLDTEDSRARIEVGGELLSVSFKDRTTLVLKDHYGDYIVQNTPGVFVCIAPTSKLNRKQMSHLEKMFEIYATFMKETQELKIPEGVESAAATVKKVVQEKAPVVVKTSSFLKNSSIRAFRRMRVAIVKEPVGVDQPPKEEDEKFEPLREACLKFRHARNKKQVRYF